MFSFVVVDTLVLKQVVICVNRVSGFIWIYFAFFLGAIVAGLTQRCDSAIIMNARAHVISLGLQLSRYGIVLDSI